MAVTEGKIPWTFTAVADADSHKGRVPLGKIEVFNGGKVAGSVNVRDKSGGSILLQGTVAAGDTLAKDYPIGTWTEGIYITALPTGATVYVWPRGPGG